MKKLVLLSAFVLCALLMFSSFTADAGKASIIERFAAAQDKGANGVYNFDKAHSTIGFRIKHLGLVEVPGYFRDFTGTINYNTDVAKSSVEFTAKMTSVDTRVEARDKHLRSADFFEVEKFPEMTFKSTKIEKKGKQWIINGDLTMKGVTKQISFPFDIAGFITNERGTRMGSTAETVINRRDFGINYGKVLPNGAQELSDDVRVVLNIEAVMPPAKTAAE